MRAASDMTPHPANAITPESSVMDAARLMGELKVGALPVCDGHAVVGLVTDSDLTAAQGRAPRSTAVAEVMQWCGEDEHVEEMLRRAADRQSMAAAHELHDAPGTTLRRPR